MTTKGWWDESHPDTSISDVYPAHILGVEPLNPDSVNFASRRRSHVVPLMRRDGCLRDLEMLRCPGEWTRTI